MKSVFHPSVLGGCLVIAAAGLWISFPYLAETALEQWLHSQGYQDVVIRIGHPSWNSVAIFEVNLTHNLQGEAIVIQVQKAAIHYSLSGLLSGRFDRVLIPEASVVLKKLALSHAEPVEADESDTSETMTSPFNVVTVSDLVQAFPVLPFGELQLGRLAVTRDEATGPLRRVALAGTVRQQEEGLLAELSLQGEGTQSYVLRVTDLATQVLSVQLEHESQPRKPIAYWRSEASSAGNETRLRGQIELDVGQMAPFLALLLPVGSELQQVSGRIQASWAGTAPSATALASVWRDPDTKLEGTVQAQMHLPEVKGVGKDLTVTTAGRFSGNPSRIQWVLSQGTLLSATVNLKRVALLKPVQRELPPGPQPFLIKSRADVQGELFWRESPIRVTVQGPLELTYGGATSPFRLRLVATHVMGVGAVIARAEGSFRFDGSLPPSVAHAVASTAVMVDLKGSVRLDDERLQGRLDTSSMIIVTGLSADVLAIDRAKMAITEAVPFMLNVHSGEWFVERSMLGIHAPEIRVKESPVRTEQATVQLESAQGTAASWSAKGMATIRGLTVPQPQGNAPTADWTIRFAADHVSAQAEIEARLRTHPVVLAAMVQHEWKTQRGTVHLTASPVTFDRTTFRLRQLLAPWRYPFDVTEGTVFASADAVWEPDLRTPERNMTLHSGSAEITLDRISAQYREIPIAGVSATLIVRTEGRDRLVTVRPTTVKIASVNPGVEVSNMSMAVEGEWDRREAGPVVEVRDFRCEVLGGTVTSQGVRANPTRPPYAFTVLVKQLDLQKVLSLEQQKGLEGSGILDGVIPVTVGVRGVTVKDGQLEARPPGGVIRYGASADAAKAITQSNANMELVLQALNNFHYNVLQIGAQYAEGGMLNLRARLEGKNPDMKKSPPFHFNLSVQENIPALLKSLRLVQDIEESVQKKFVRP